MRKLLAVLGLISVSLVFVGATVLYTRPPKPVLVVQHDSGRLCHEAPGGYGPYVALDASTRYAWYHMPWPGHEFNSFRFIAKRRQNGVWPGNRWRTIATVPGNPYQPDATTDWMPGFAANVLVANMDPAVWRLRVEAINENGKVRSKQVQVNLRCRPPLGPESSARVVTRVLQSEPGQPLKRSHP